VGEKISSHLSCSWCVKSCTEYIQQSGPKSIYFSRPFTYRQNSFSVDKKKIYYLQYEGQCGSGIWVGMFY